MKGEGASGVVAAEPHRVRRFLSLSCYPLADRAKYRGRKRQNGIIVSGTPHGLNNKLFGASSATGIGGVDGAVMKVGVVVDEGRQQPL